MAIKEDFQFGDILATHGDRFLSKAIQFFMRIYTKRILKKKYKVIFNHNAIIINVWGEKWVCEAMGWGMRSYPIELSGYLEQKEIVILRDKRGFSDDQVKEMSKKMASMAGVRYQYEAFIQHIGKIIFKKKTFHANGENEITCSELAAIAIDEAYPNTFNNPNGMNPMDHFYAENYEIIDINRILE